MISSLRLQLQASEVLAISHQKHSVTVLAILLAWDAILGIFFPGTSKSEKRRWKHCLHSFSFTFSFGLLIIFPAVVEWSDEILNS